MQIVVEMCAEGTGERLIGMDESLNDIITTVNDTVTTVDEDNCDYQPSQLDDESNRVQ